MATAEDADEGEEMTQPLAETVKTVPHADGHGFSCTEQNSGYKSKYLKFKLTHFELKFSLRLKLPKLNILILLQL